MKSYLATYQSPLGPLTLCSDGEALTGLWFDGQKYDRATVEPDATEAPDLTIFRQTREWLNIYFRGKQPPFTPPLKLSGSEFQQAVGRILLSIPYGKTMTYGQIASRLALEMGVESMSAQAIGGAVGHNPISIIVPCHRVMGSDGSPTGYAGGLYRKNFLMQMEFGYILP